MPTVITQGAASAKGYGFGASATAANYIEDVFSTYLFTGNGSTQTVTNGIDLSTKGGLVWFKRRDVQNNHALVDSARGVDYWLRANSTAAQLSFSGNSFTAPTFTTTGFTTSNYDEGGGTNNGTYASWTFRKQAKFFDVVTFTSNASRGATFSHNLGSSPGCVIIKRTDGTENWWVWHRTFTSSQYIVLNSNGTSFTGVPTLTASSTQIVLSDLWLSAANANYVAYIFAHDAGGFGASGADNVITCGNYTGNGSTTGPVVTLGYEPQWLLIKATNSAPTDWNIIDNMRGFVVGGADAELNPNAATAETTGTYVTPTATGFQLNTTDTSYNTNNGNYIYIAIRRGPMKTPTTGTSVFGLSARTGTGANATVTGGQTDDAVLIKNRGSAVASLFSSRLTGTGYLVTSSTAAEVAAGTTILQANPWDVMDGVKLGTTSTITNASANTYINYLFRRAPGFFDVVCYTGTGSATTVSHNLGVVPELMIVKPRNLAGENWIVYCSLLNTPEQNRLVLNGTFGQLTTPNATWWNSTKPTSSVFSLGTPVGVNGSGYTYVNYLFATVAGVSKVGSYTGSGTTKQIDCGFTGGARFVMIKRTDSTGDWYVWDSARGIVAGNDPYLLLNSTAAEVTSTDYIDTYSAGFEISSTAPAAINANGGTFIFLAIA